MKNRGNIIVTGGLGFIGSHTVVSLVENGYNPVIIDDCRNSQPFIHAELEAITGRRIEWVKSDYRDFKTYRHVLNHQDTVGLIHFAAYKAVGESVEHPLMYYDNNVRGFIELLSEIKDSQVKNVVFSSSCTVYGQPKVNPVDELAPFQPAESPYGATKQMCEQILKDFTQAHHQINCISLRYFNPVGAHHSHRIGELPMNRPNNLMPLVVMAAKGDIEKLTVYGADYATPDGTCIRDYLHIEDLANAHVKALSYLLSDPTINYNYINLGTGKGYSVLDVIHEFMKENNVTVPYSLGDRRSGDVESIFADTTKASQLIGWTAEKNLSDMVRDAWKWSLHLEEDNPHGSE